MLSLGLLVLLAGVTIGVFWGVLGETRTQESANRMSALLRIARAEAANAGRRFRLSFDEQTGQPVVSIEADPLAAPGAFQPYASWWARQGQLQEGTRVALCRRTGDSAFLEDSQASEGPRSKDEAALEEIHFYTDGSSDSARIVLTNDDEEHPWAVEITLNGLDGTIATREIDTAVEPIE